VDWKSTEGPLLPTFGRDVWLYSRITGEWGKGRRIGTGWVHPDSRPFKGATDWAEFVAPDETTP
jgi:hypothetical protein